jgi:hypothetical protein
MLKIKGNVDLKELEKFGFREIKNEFVHTYLINQASYGLNGIEINVETRELYIEILDNSMSIILYDLIKADLIEKSDE